MGGASIAIKGGENEEGLGTRAAVKLEENLRMDTDKNENLPMKYYDSESERVYK